MREIKFLGTFRQDGASRAYQYAIFECPECHMYVEKPRRDGAKATYCSQKCSAKNRTRRGAYRESVIISGYRYLQTPDHPHATKKGYVAEHRIVAENAIKRLLNKDEVVHHIDGNTLNNSITNLQVMRSSDHTKLHRNGGRRNEYGQFSI